jgi:hypothetical protein
MGEVEEAIVGDYVASQGHLLVSWVRFTPMRLAPGSTGPAFQGHGTFDYS